jgi:mono/diheme cytochrome c family protein
MAVGRSFLAIKPGAAPALLVCALLAPALFSVMAQQEKLVERGRFLFRVYCQNCHGETGRGDGPTAAMMKVTPSDLTRIRRDNEGEFPFDRIHRTIDGRQEVRGHGAARMPVWGLAFQELDRDVNQKDEVRGKILQLIEFLESIQE